MPISTSAAPSIAKKRNGEPNRTERIRIALFTDSFMRGGTERQFTRMATSLDPAAFDVHVCCLRRDGPLAEEVGSAGMRITEFPLTSLHNFGTLRQFAKLTKYLRNARIQILHAFGFYTDVFAVPAARMAGVPIILASRRELLNLRSRWQRRAVKFACRISTDVVVNSRAAAADVLDGGLANAERLHLIPNCIPLQAVEDAGDRKERRARLGIDGEALVVGTLCVLRPEKDIETFLRACRIVRESVAGARFVIIGDGPQRKGLEDLTEKLALRDAVLFLGARDDVQPLLSVLDVFVLTSRTESFPNAILEAMAARLPVVATNVGGVPEVVEDGDTGFLVPPADGAGIAQRIIELLGDEGARRVMGDRALERVREKYSVERVSARLQELYQELFDNRRGGRT